MLDLIECPACDGPAQLLGTLGRLAHFTCRNCGSAWAVNADSLAAAEVDACENYGGSE
jgi:transposase-like protein